jgi:uncharacterized protein YuzE
MTAQVWTSTHDIEADAGYVRLGEGKVTRTEEVFPDMFLDISADGKVIGIEILNVSQTLASQKHLLPRSTVVPADAAE